MVSTSANYVQDFVKNKNPADLLSLLAFDDDDHYFITDDKTIGVTFVCQPLVGMDTAVFNMLQSFLSINYPDHSILQISLFASPNILPFIKAFERCRDIENCPARNKDLLKEILHQQTMWMKKATRTGVDARGILQMRDFTNIISLSIPIASVTPNEKELHVFRELKREMMSSLHSAGMFPMIAKERQMMELYKTLLNWGNDAGWREGFQSEILDNLEFRQQLFDYETAIEVEKDYIKLGDSYARMMSIKSWPDSVQIGMMSQLIGDAALGTNGVRNNFLYTLNVYFPPVEQFRSKLSQKRQYANHGAFSAMIRHAPRIARQKEGHDIMYESMQDGSRPIKAYLQFVQYAKTKEELDMVTGNARAVYRTANFDVQTDPYISLPLFLNALPLNAEHQVIPYLDRYHTMTTEHLIHLMPVLGDWKGRGKPVLSLISRQGQPIAYDIFSGHQNYNFLICAQSGSGKSTLANELINNYLSTGAYAWVIDNGGSYRKLNELVGGDYIDFGRNNTPNLNPFPHINNILEHEDMLVNQLIAMAFYREPPNDYQDASLRDILHELWEKHGQNTTITHVREACINAKDDLLISMGKQLGQFSIHGNYGKYFHGDNPVDYKAGLTVLELEALQGAQHLQQVVLLQLISQVTHHIGSMDRAIRKLLLMDECWALFKLSDVSSFLETSWRTIRKFGGSAGAITQSVNDVYSTNSGVAIAENSETIFLLSQKESTIELLKDTRRLPMDDYDYRLLKSVKTIPGEFSEIFIYTDNCTAVGRLYLDRFRQLLYTTLPDEVSALNAAQANGCSIKEAILRVMAAEGSLIHE